MGKPFIHLEIVDKNGGMVRKVASRKSKRIFNFIKAEKNKDCVFLVKVNYRKGFTNKGEYHNRKDLIHALRAFLEKD